MTRQEEIFEGIAKHFRPHTFGDIDDDLTGFIAGEAVGTMELYRVKADELLNYLHSQGVRFSDGSALLIDKEVKHDTTE